MSNHNSQTIEPFEDQEVQELDSDESLSFLQIFPQQLANFWPLLKLSLLESVAPSVHLSEQNLSKIQQHILQGNLLAWGVKQGETMIALSTTAINEDAFTGSRTLVVYSLSVFGTALKNDVWKELFEMFQTLANNQDCESITAYTTNARVIKIVKFLGGETEGRLISLPLGD